MEQFATRHKYSWQIDLSNYADHWLENAEDAGQYKDAMNFAGYPLTFNKLDSKNSEIRLKDVDFPHENLVQESLRATFISTQETSLEERKKARNEFLEVLEESYMMALTRPSLDESILEQGITYETDVEEDGHPVTIYPDPDWEGPVMQSLVSSDIVNYDTLEEFREM
jgi:hypothetical protein